MYVCVPLYNWEWPGDEARFGVQIHVHVCMVRWFSQVCVENNELQ